LAAALSVFEPWLDAACARRLKKAPRGFGVRPARVRDRDVGLGLLREGLERESWMRGTGGAGA